MCIRDSCSADATGKAIIALNTRTPTILMEIDTDVYKRQVMRTAA